jgi:hypothetical protein
MRTPSRHALRLSAGLAALVACAACSSASQEPPGAASAGSGSDAGTKVAGPEALGFPTDTCEGFVVDEGEFTVQPGQDINYCVRVPIPPEWQTRDLALGVWAWDLANTHHFFMEYSPHPFPGQGTEPVACPSYKWNTATNAYDFVPDQKPEGTFSFIGSANSEDSKIIFGAGQGKGYVMFDKDHGRFMAQNGHFRTSHHLINLTDKPITTHAKFKVCIKDAANLPFVANSLVCTTTNINVPAGEQGKTVATCTAPYDLDVFLLASHAHAHLTRFTLQRYDGTKTLPDLIYESKNWDAPEIKNLDTPLHLKKGEGLTYTCEYNGPAVFSDTTEKAEAEHCAVFTAYSYPDPRPGVVPTQLTGLQSAPPQDIGVAFPSLSVSPI